MPAVRCKNPLRVVRWHGSEGMLCLVVIIPCDPQEGAGEEDALHDGGAGEGPPDAVEAERAAQDDREWDAGAGEGDAQDAAQACLSEAGEGTDGGELDAHEGFTEADDDEVADRGGDGLWLVEEDAGERSREADEDRGDEQTPESDGEEGDEVALPDPVMLRSAIILGDEGIERGGEAVCCVPGDGLDLSADTLGSDGFCTVAGDHAGENHGDRAVGHALESGRDADLEDALEDTERHPGEKAGALQDVFLVAAEDAEYHDQHDDGMRGDGCDGGTGDAETRERARAEDQHRIEHHVDDEADEVRDERGLRVTLGGIEAGEGQAQEGEDHEAAGDARVGDRGGVGLGVAQLEEVHERVHEGDADKRVEEAHQRGQLYGGLRITMCAVMIAAP